MEALAADDHVWVRRTVAANRSTPADVLDALAEDEDAAVLRAVAGNPNASLEALSSLAGRIDEMPASDEEPILRAVVANSALPKEMFYDADLVHAQAARLKKADNYRFD